MPTYYARGVTVRLGVNSLANTVTPNITLKKGDTAKKQAEKPEKALLNSTLLPEQRVNFAGDDRGFELNWLGGAPFIQVRAGDGLFKDATRDYAVPPAAMAIAARTRRQPAMENIYTSGSDPLALSLHVKTSDMTFVSGLDKHKKLHLKIEVFFNGQLSSCLFLPAYEIRNSTKTHHQVFAGYRVDYLAERPWIILPPQTAADGSPRKIKSAFFAEKRWKDIGKALSREANERGMDKHGNVPPTSKFLKALATLGMPDQVVELQQRDSRNFGIIDVVITAGEGRKVTSGTGYLTKPQRFTDENFLLAASSGDLDIVVGVAEQSNVSIAVDEGYDEDAEGESDSAYDPQPKRQALNPISSAMLSESKGTFPPTSQTSRDVQNRAASMSIQETPVRLLASVNATLPSKELPSPEPTKASQELLSSPERGHAGYKDYSSIAGHGPPRQGTLGKPESLYSIANSSAGLSSTPQMRLSPYSFQLSDPVLGRNTPSGMMSLQSLNHAGFVSSPMRGAPQQINMMPTSTFHTQPLHGGMMANGSQHRAPQLCGIQEHRGSMDSTFKSPFMLSVPPLWPPVPCLGSQPFVSASSPSHVPNMLPFTRSIGDQLGPSFGGLPFPLPQDRRLSMPLPPTGLFTVPVKPRSSLSPSKKRRPTNLRMPQRGFLLKRLIITGKDGATIVNHDWPIAQHIAVNEHSFGRCEADGLPTTKHFATASTLAASSSVIFDPEQREKSAQTMMVPGTVSSPGRNSPYELPIEATKGSNGLRVANGRSTRLEISSSRGTESDADVESAAAMDTHLTSGDMKKSARNTLQPRVPQRRTTSATNILGVQGPKAITFLYDDPEAMIREEKKARRSRSPVKRSKKASMARESTTPAPAKAAVPFKVADDQSSPLSSLATTPEPKFEIETVTHQMTPFVLSKANIPDAIEQLDGSPERASPTASPAKPTSSPKVLASMPPTLSPPKAATTPQSSPSSNTKKRSIEAGRRLPKQPRSPDRLKTVGNPPLNRDCVIAFAESEDKDSEKGVLRQVKSERQGVFAEEYVVFASRFYVAGN
jgi:hypothetical protein